MEPVGACSWRPVVRWHGWVSWFGHRNQSECGDNSGIVVLPAFPAAATEPTALADQSVWLSDRLQPVSIALHPSATSDTVPLPAHSPHLQSILSNRCFLNIVSFRSKQNRSTSGIAQHNTVHFLLICTKNVLVAAGFCQVNSVLYCSNEQRFMARILN